MDDKAEAEPKIAVNKYHQSHNQFTLGPSQDVQLQRAGIFAPKSLTAVLNRSVLQPPAYNSLRCENFCIVQCSHLVWNQSLSPPM